MELSVANNNRSKRKLTPYKSLKDEESTCSPNYAFDDPTDKNGEQFAKFDKSD